MSETLQLEERVTQLHTAPKLLVEWSSRWQEFRSSIGPAFGPSGQRLAGEAPFGILPYRGLAASVALEAFLLFVLLVLPREIDRLRPYAVPRIRAVEVIYYSGDELPRTEDLGGSQSGATGRAGGNEAHHRTQTIRIARGKSLSPKIVDAPNLKLPSSADAVANLLAIHPIPGPPPAEGLHAALTLPNLPANIVAPSPSNVSREQSRRGFTLESVVPPAPAVSRDRTLIAPALNSAVIAPAPNVSRDRALVAPALNATVIAPSPNVARDRALIAPALNSSVIAPAAASVSGEKPRSSPALSSNVIPPAPAASGHEVSRSPVQMNEVAVVPPPVSAPERDSVRNPKLTMPAPSVIAPPPSQNDAHDLRRLASGSMPDASTSVVPPPPTSSNSGIVSTLIGKIFGTQDVVPPPPTVASGSSRNSSGLAGANVVPPPPVSVGNSGSGRAVGTLKGADVVPPPPSVSSGSTGRNAAALGNAGVVAPPPSLAGSASPSGTASGSMRHASLGDPNIVPPPPSVSATGTGRGTGASAGGSDTLLATNVVPPPPGLASDSSAGVSGLGRKGLGLGGPGGLGSVSAPPNPGGGSGGGSGLVVTPQPGSKIAAPASGGPGSTAMSPAGGEKPGLGGSGAGEGIGRGTGPGSGMNGAASGAGKTGTGRGSEPNARGGVSPTTGPSGAGSSNNGPPTVPGVDVKGGSTAVVNLPSFGDSASDPSVPGRSSLNKQPRNLGVEVVSNSSAAFESYKKLLPGRETHTQYLDTPLGTVVMEYADAAYAQHAKAGRLSGPQQIRTDLPSGLPRARMVVACILDASGNLTNLKVIEPGPATMTAKVVAALRSWKFQPALVGDQPIEVNAVLGFNINTDDRF